MPRSRDHRLTLWAGAGLLAYVVLPWYDLQQQSLNSAWALLFEGPETANGWTQALVHQRPWLLAGLVALALSLLSRLGATQGNDASGRWHDRLLVLAAASGLFTLLASGFAIGASGWAFESLEALFGPLPSGQYGIGWGGAVVLLCLVVLLGAGLARLGAFGGDAFVASAVLISASLLALFVAYPVLRALSSAWVGDDGSHAWRWFFDRIASGRVWGIDCVLGPMRCGSAWNTLWLALLTAVGTTVLGTLLALWAERGRGRLAPALNSLALLPIIMPPFVVGLGLILLFGRAGLFNQALDCAFGIAPTRWFYGLFGVWLAQMFAFTPIAFLIMRGVIQAVSPSLEEAAMMLRASPRHAFLTVTFPLIRPGLANAFLVGFIESIADFGNPILLGGQYSVLSTDIFFAIVGAAIDPGMAGALALILTFFALIAFAIQRLALAGRHYTTVTGKGESGRPIALPRAVLGLCRSVAGPWLIFTVVVYLFAFAGGFVQTWGRDHSLTLAHFRTAFELQWGEHGLIWAGTAWRSLFTTVMLAAIAAPLCAVFGLLVAWLVERARFRGRSAFEFSALLTFAIPGTVLGVSYILAFNVPPFELTGTGLIIVLCFVFRSLPVGVRSGSAALRQIDRSLDEASLMLRAGTLRTLWRVSLPLLKPAVVAALVYSFVRSMTTVSAVIFLVTAQYELATTYIIGRAGNGEYGVALAYCSVLIVLMLVATLTIRWLIGERQLGRRSAHS